MTAQPKRVLFLLAEFPEYREAVLTAIADDPRIEASFFGAPQPRVAGIEPFDASVLTRTIFGRNLSIGPLYWQVGAFSAILRVRPKAVVFLGDTKVVSTWLLAALCRVLGVRTLFWTIGWHRSEGGIKRIIRMAFYRIAHGLLLYGKQGYRYGLSLGYPARRMTIIGNSTVGPREIDVMPTSAVRSAVVCVGRLTSVKRLDLVIEAAALVDGVTVELVGDGPDRDSLQELATRLGVDCVFHGESHDPALLADVYSRAICTVIPGAAGLSVTQSLAYGVPVITNNLAEDQMPEAEAVIDGVTGSLYERDDVGSLAHAIERWRAMSAEEWSAASQACLAEYRANWTPEHHAELIVRAVTRDARSFAKWGEAASTDFAAIKRIVFWQNAPSIHFAPMIRAIARRGYDVHVVTELALARERQELGWNAVDFSGVRTHFSPSSDQRRALEGELGPYSHHVFTGTGAYPQTFRSLKRIAADPAVNGRLVVFTESWNAYDWKAPLRAVRYIVRSHAVPERVDTVLATGNLAVAQFERVMRHSVEVLPFAYSVDPVPVNFVDNDGPVLFVGKLERRKQVGWLLRAYAASALKRPLVIIGDGPDRVRLEALARQLGIAGRVAFLGAMANHEARRYMADARALVLPSKFDGWGAVVNEALDAGCYVVASARCGSAQLLGPGRGSVFRDMRDLEQALVRLDGVDPARDRQARSEWARSKVAPEPVARYLTQLVERRRGTVVTPQWLGTTAQGPPRDVAG